MSKTILVVEDDKSVARLLVDVLEAEGFKVLIEHDGEWGLRTCQDKPVDLAIVDVLIPKLKGFDLIERLRKTEKGRALPVVVVSGVYRAAVYRERLASEHGVLACLDKPIDVKRLVAVIRAALSSEGGGEAMSPLRPSSMAPTAPGTPGLSRSGGSAGPLAALPPVPAEGRVDDVPFARLIGHFFAERASGTLLLKRGATKKIVYLRQGVPLFVKSNLVSECLGRILVAERLISEEECARSLEKRKPGKKQGEILIEMGSISQHNLEFALELQMQTKLYEVFSWLEGAYHFMPQDDFSGQQVALSLSPTALIHEGARRTMSTERIRRDLAPVTSMFVTPTGDPTFRYQALELEPSSGALLDALDGSRMFESLFEGFGLPMDDAVRLLYALTCTGLLRFDTSVFVIARKPELAEHSVPIEEQDVDELSAEIADVVGLSPVATGAGAIPMGPVAVSTSPTPAEPGPSPGASSSPPLVRDLITSDPSLSLPVPPGAEVTVMRPLPLRAEASPASMRETSPASMREASPASMREASPASMREASPASMREALSSSRDEPTLEVYRERRSILPRVASGLPSARPSARPAPSEDESVFSDVPTLSDEVRRAVRARLDLEAKKITSERPARAQGANVVPASGANGASMDGAAPSGLLVGSALMLGTPAGLWSGEEGGALRNVANAKPGASAQRPSRRYGVGLELGRDEEEAREELIEKLEALGALDAYAVLGVSRTATSQEIRAAYERAKKENHPDRVLPGTTSRELRALAERVSLLFERAFDTLFADDTRLAYDRRLGLTTVELAPIMRAEAAFLRGRELLDAGDLAGARAALAEALELNPTEVAHMVYLAFVGFSMAPKSDEAKAAALLALEQAEALAPDLEELHLFRGMIHQTTGDRVEAVRAFERVIRLNPDNLQALDALKSLEPPAQKKAGLLSRLTIGGGS